MNPEGRGGVQTADPTEDVGRAIVTVGHDRLHRTAAASSLTVSRSPQSVRAARDFVGQQCIASGIGGDTLQTAILLTSEVVTNALLHGGSDAHITVTISRTRLHVEVRDASTSAPEILDQGTDATHGRGLAIIDALATAWGTRAGARGKVVWFDLERD